MRGGDSARGPATAAERWRALGPGRQALLALVALIVSANVLLAGAQRLVGSEPGGEPSSSYATAPEGAAAYADLLARQGHPVQRLRTGLDEADLPPTSTVVVLDPPKLDDPESEALARFVHAGGRLVVAGQQGAPLLRRLLEEGPVWSPAGTERSTPLAPASEVASVGSVRAAGEGSWRSVGSALPVLGGSGDENELLAAVAAVGLGRVVLVADPSVFQNRLLGEEYNAALAVAAAGGPNRPVSFAEAAHGYLDGEGLAALPSRWRWALGGATVAALVWMWSRGRRFGPAEDVVRDLPPPRRAYVDAVAAAVARTRQPDSAIEPLRDAARRRLAQRASLPPDTDDEALVEAARRLGGDPADMARLLAPVRDDDLVGAGRAAAWVLAKGS